MDVHFTDDVEAYASAVLPYLQRDPVRHTVGLSVIEYTRLGLSRSAVWSWASEDGDVLGTASWNPPFNVVVTSRSDVALLALAKEWAALEPLPGGVVGAREVAEPFARQLAARTGATPRERFAERLFRVDEVTVPTQPPGRPRLGEPTDLDVAEQWLDAFITETGIIRGSDVRRDVELRIEQSRLWFWHDEETVAFVGHAPTVAGVTRIGPVYTPPEQRGRGYARALVATVSQARLDAGDSACCLFTDLANPVSNQIYQQVGYRPVGDYAQISLVR